MKVQNSLCAFPAPSRGETKKQNRSLFSTFSGNPEKVECILKLRNRTRVGNAPKHQPFAIQQFPVTRKNHYPTQQPFQYHELGE